MVQWPEDWQQRIIDALTEAGADRPCPRCGHEDFNLVDGYVSQHALTVLLASDIEEAGGGTGGQNGAP